MTPSWPTNSSGSGSWHPQRGTPFNPAELDKGTEIWYQKLNAGSIGRKNNNSNSSGSGDQKPANKYGIDCPPPDLMWGTHLWNSTPRDTGEVLKQEAELKSQEQQPLLKDSASQQPSVIQQRATDQRQLSSPSNQYDLEKGAQIWEQKLKEKTDKLERNSARKPKTQHRQQNGNDKPQQPSAKVPRPLLKPAQVPQVQQPNRVGAQPSHQSSWSSKPQRSFADIAHAQQAAVQAMGQRAHATGTNGNLQKPDSGAKNAASANGPARDGLLNSRWATPTPVTNRGAIQCPQTQGNCGALSKTQVEARAMQSRNASGVDGAWDQANVMGEKDRNTKAWAVSTPQDTNDMNEKIRGTTGPVASGPGAKTINANYWAKKDSHLRGGGWHGTSNGGWDAKPPDKDNCDNGGWDSTGWDSNGWGNDWNNFSGSNAWGNGTWGQKNGATDTWGATKPDGTRRDMTKPEAMRLQMKQQHNVQQQKFVPRRKGKWRPKEEWDAESQSLPETISSIKGNHDENDLNGCDSDVASIHRGRVRDVRADIADNLDLAQRKDGNMYNVTKYLERWNGAQPKEDYWEEDDGFRHSWRPTFCETWAGVPDFKSPPEVWAIEQKVNQHERCDVDTVTGFLMPPVEYPDTIINPAHLNDPIQKARRLGSTAQLDAVSYVDKHKRRLVRLDAIDAQKEEAFQPVGNPFPVAQANPPATQQRGPGPSNQAQTGPKDSRANVGGGISNNQQQTGVQGSQPGFSGGPIATSQQAQGTRPKNEKETQGAQPNTGVVSTNKQKTCIQGQRHGVGGGPAPNQQQTQGTRLNNGGVLSNQQQPSGQSSRTAAATHQTQNAGPSTKHGVGYQAADSNRPPPGVKLIPIKQELSTHQENVSEPWVKISCFLRPVEEGDLRQILNIYNWEVRNGMQALDTKPLCLEDIQRLYEQCQSNETPFVVAIAGTPAEAEARRSITPPCRGPYQPQRPGPYQQLPQKPEQDKVLGFGFISIPSTGLAGDVRDSVGRYYGRAHFYVAHDSRRKGIGRALLFRLARCCSIYFSYNEEYKWENSNKVTACEKPTYNPRYYIKLFIEIGFRVDTDPETTWLYKFINKEGFDVLGTMEKARTIGSGEDSYLLNTLLCTMDCQDAETVGQGIARYPL